jgi:hypothetical protein
VALFRKKPAGHPISEFWSWWTTMGAALCDAALERNAPTEIAGPLTKRLARINPDLIWETSAGRDARHRLTVSANGNARLRPTAERWLRAGPAADSVWEYRTSKERDPDGTVGKRLDIAGHQLDLDESLFATQIDRDANRVHVEVYHPEFADMPPDARTTVAFLLLDWVVGEDDVERWIGLITAVVERPLHPGSAAGLTASVSELTAENDPDHWVLARGKDENGHWLLATLRRGVRWIDYPIFDLHHLIRLGYDANDEGLPGPEELDRLRHEEDRLQAAIGKSAILIGHISSQGRRTLHYYSDSEDQNVTEAIQAAAAAVGASIDSRPDPAWSAVRQLTG